MKECTRCHEVKSLEDFNRKASKKDGRRAQCRECEHEVAKIYRSTDQHRAALRRYWDTEEYKQLRAAEYQKNRESIRAAQARYRKKYRQRPEVREKRRVENHNRRNALVGELPSDCLTKLIELYGNRCMNPNCPQDGSVLTIDHVKPVATGGLNVFENTQILCMTCNTSKGHRSEDDYRSRDD